MKAMHVVGHIFLLACLYHLIAINYNIMVGDEPYPIVCLGFFCGSFGLGIHATYLYYRIFKQNKT
jgi:hypothetical protein